MDVSYRHLEATRQITALVATGALGMVAAVDLTFHNAYGPGQPWYFDRAQAGGGCLLDLGVHLLDLLASWTGHVPFEVQAAALSANGQPWTGRSSVVEDFALVQLRSASGITARLACSWGTPSGCDAVSEARLFGTRGGARIRNVDGSFYDFAAEHLDRARSACSPHRPTTGAAARRSRGRASSPPAIASTGPRPAGR